MKPKDTTSPRSSAFHAAQSNRSILKLTTLRDVLDDVRSKIDNAPTVYGIQGLDAVDVNQLEGLLDKAADVVDQAQNHLRRMTQKTLPISTGAR